MPDIDPRQALILRLNSLTLDNYRRARWEAVDDARDNGLTWHEVGEAIGMEKSQVRRIWLAGPPSL